MRIGLLDLKRQYHSIKDEIDTAIQNVLENGHFIMGGEVEEFEQAMAKYCGVKHAIGVASGTDALLLALRALNIGPGDEVIVPTFTFFATAGAVTRLGGTPVFADIDPVTFNITPEEIERLITPRTKAIIPVHLYGQPCDMKGIMQVARAHKLAVVEDACQAVGAKFDGTTVGNFGDATALSFFPSKNLGAYGDAGMILSNDDELAETMKLLRVHGMKPKYFHHTVGYNSRLDTLQAAILHVKLRYLDQWTEGRQRVAEKYDAAFSDAALQGLVAFPGVVPEAEHVYHQYVVRVAERDRLAAFMKEKGVDTAIYYPRCLHEQECYHDIAAHITLPVAEEATKCVLALPIDPAMTDEEINYVIATIREFYQK